MLQNGMHNRCFMSKLYFFYSLLAVLSTAVSNTTLFKSVTVPYAVIFRMDDSSVGLVSLSVS